MELWGGRFSKDLDPQVNDFNSSIAFDARMYQDDIEGSIAHATMLGDCGIISKEDSRAIVEGLQGIRADLDSGALAFDPNAEDIHMFVETELTRRLGDVGKRLHTARSRNDQVAVDLRLYLRREIQEIRDLTLHLCHTILDLSKDHFETVMPGYTHMQRAQPVTFAHHLLAYAQMFLRDIGRLDDTAARMNESPLGSCALAGTTYPIDRDETAELLGFDAPCANSLDGVSDRDYCIELLSALSTEMMHMSRLSEEIVLWCSWEFKFVELDDAYATGSSIMPQKKNPDVCELIRGKTARVYGDLQTLLTMMKGLPLAYNKDMQEDKEAVFDAVDSVKLCLSTLDPMLATMTVHPEAMRKAAAGGFINATDCADYLVKKGMPFRDAHEVSGKLVALCMQKGCDLEALPLEDYKALSPLFEEDIYEAISLETCVRARTSYGGPSPDAVRTQWQQVADKVAALEEI